MMQVQGQQPAAMAQPAARRVRFGEDKTEAQKRIAAQVDQYLKERGELPERKQETLKQKDWTEGEVLGCNLAGMAGSLAAGFGFGEPLLGFLGMFVAPIPVFYGLHLYKKMRGQPSSIRFQFKPGISRNWERRKN